MRLPGPCLTRAGAGCRGRRVALRVTCSGRRRVAVRGVNARQPELAQESTAWKETFKRLRKSHARADIRALMEINRRINGIFTVIEGELKAQAPSSERGGQGPPGGGA